MQLLANTSIDATSCKYNIDATSYKCNIDATSFVFARSCINSKYKY